MKGLVAALPELEGEMQLPLWGLEFISAFFHTNSFFFCPISLSAKPALKPQKHRNLSQNNWTLNHIHF